MSQIKSCDTRPELIVRKYLSSKGYRYRLNYLILGKPDIVFVSKKIAIFVHGCFWHMHNCKNFSIPKSNTEFWKKKLCNNKKRDLFVKKKLKSNGWSCITIWECKIRKKPEEELKKLTKNL